MDIFTQMLLRGSAGGSKSTYVEDVFSTYTFIGNATARSINNGIDNTKGGLVWIKDRTDGYNHVLQDTVRGAGATTKLSSNLGNGANDGDNALQWSGYVSAFNSNGFSLDKTGSGAIDWANVNKNNDNYTSWSFRKASKWMDIKQWSGNGTDNRVISHDLECIPGCIIMKDLEGSENWVFYHRDLPTGKILRMNKTHSLQTADLMGSTRNVTSTGFTIGNGNEVNGAGKDYIAYIFQGGESDAATARSVDFDGNDYLSIPVNNSDFDWAADGSLTIEAWVNMDDIDGQTYNSIINRWGGSGTYSFGLDVKSNGNLFFYRGNGSSITTHESSGVTINVGQWYHIAVVKDGTTGRFFINGQACGTFTWNEAFTNSTNIPLHIGNLSDGNSYPIDGRISNARFVNGQALYTTSFRPSTEPLTTTSQSATASNVKLLCCNNSSTTGSTVTPGTITANGDPTASTDSPFDDPEGFQFGEEGDQNIFKCGSYIGNGSSNGPDINMGWEPQWFIVKNVTSSNTNWLLFDSMRGLTDSDQSSEANIKPNSSDAEWDNEYLSPTSRGFRLTNGGSTWVNESGSKFIYIAIRRPDGYVGKPAEAGTDSFAMDAGAGSSTIPNFDSGFPVDFAFEKTIAGGNSWSTGARLIQGRYLYTNTDMAAGTWDKMVFDSNTGWNNNSSYGSGDQSWMWKRGAGFDVVTWNGNGVTGRNIPHSMGKTPEMMWVKRRSNTEDWTVYHYGQNGGTNPEQYRLRLNSAVMNYTGTSYWNDTAPTSTHFTVGADGAVNNSGNTFIGILFASVAGISKLGSWVGDGGTQTITLGFQPRFLLLKTWNTGGGWYMLDTRRGWGAGNDASLQLQEGNAQVSSRDDGAPTATGFTVTGDVANEVGRSYIYYAHA